MLVTQTAMALTAVVARRCSPSAASTQPGRSTRSRRSGAAAGAFDSPARQSLVPTLVPREHLPNAISLNAIMLQVASVAGPSVGGLLIATLGVAWVYVVQRPEFGASSPRSDDARRARRAIRRRPATSACERCARASASSSRSPLIRSTMLLDFFATFFSSATALLPIFAQDVLRVGARGYGWLYAAPSVGAVLTSVVMVRVVDRIEHRGRVLLWAVAAYGTATIVFGLSTWFWLTFVCLAVTGAADTVSTVLRNIVRQIDTPDHLRGRMTGVNMVFFMGGPQLGELEAGVVAQWLGAPASVVIGGFGCLIATGWIASRTPALRHYRRSVH